MKKIPKRFRGYAGEPTSEMEVVYLFGVLCKHLPFPFVVRAINDTFPDCEGINPLTGKTVSIEFELFSHRYKNHHHPMNKKSCDYIVCWKKTTGSDFPIPVISLQELIKKKKLVGKYFIHIPVKGLVNEQLANLKKSKPRAYKVVNHFLEVLRKLEEKFSGFCIDDKRTRHYGVKYHDCGAGVGVYPNGKLVCNTVGEMVKKFGERVRESALKMRHIVIKDIKMLCSTKDGDKIAKELEEVLLVISKPHK
ncbi:MAG: hypothetical protein V1701_01680 [Planctomycetota bacterium]